MVKPASAIEEFVNFKYTTAPARVRTESWSKPGDRADLVLRSKNPSPSRIEFSFIRAENGEPLCEAITAQLLSDQDVLLREAREFFLQHIPISALSEHSQLIQRALEVRLKVFNKNLETIYKGLEKHNWRTLKDVESLNYQFALVAFLFVTLQTYSRERVIERCAEHLEITYQAAKTRIRLARERGMLTSPGVGTKLSHLTEKAHFLIDLEEIQMKNQIEALAENHIKEEISK